MLLRLDGYTGNSDPKESPLVEYAAQHWVDHAQFEKVSSRVRDGMDNLFDTSKPHFAAWLRVHDMDEKWPYFSGGLPDGVGSPLYYAALCGFYDLAERLVLKHPEQVNARGGLILTPLLAALYKEHFHVANLLHRHGAVVDVQNPGELTPLHGASAYGQIDVMRWLLDHGADANAPNSVHRTPLHVAAFGMRLEVVEVLLEYNADINSQSVGGETPLYEASSRANGSEGRVVDVVRRLLEHGADPNIRDCLNSSPLREASSRGYLQVARLLLDYGAKVDEKDG